MASDTGFEQCGSWDTGCCEIHITADIAFAIGHYCHVTGDVAFLKDCGTEIFIQTARYWVDRFNYCMAEDQWHLLFVKGPDEYCGVTTDDFYTVSMARVNLEHAISSVRWMRENCPEDWTKLAERISFDEKETSTWQDIIDKSVLAFDEKRGVWKYKIILLHRPLCSIMIT